MQDNIYSLDGLIRQMMDDANDYYKKNTAIPGVGFLAARHPENPMRCRCGTLQAGPEAEGTEGLARFARTMRAMAYNLGAIDAGILWQLNISVDKQHPEPSAVIYVDQKYGGMRVLVAPLSGDNLVFKDFGTAHPTINFFPGLFTAESYGPAQAEA